MPAVPQFSARGAAGTIAASTTRYACIGYGISAIQTNESEHQRYVRTAGTFSCAQIVIATNDRAASTATLRVNGADSTLVIAITGSATGRFEDLTHSVTVASGDLLAMKITTGAGGSTFSHRSIGVLFAATSGVAVTLWGVTSGNTLSTASTSVFAPVVGQGTEATTEADVQARLQVAGTWRHLSVNVRTNTRPDATTIRNRINGANGSMAISVTASGTGWFHDASSTDALAVTNKVCVAVTLGAGAGSFRLWSVTTEYETSGTGCCGSSGGTATNACAASATQYCGLGGFSGIDTTEGNVKQRAEVAFTARKLQCYVVTNGVTADSTFRLRKNSTNTALVATITGLATGWFDDLSSTESITATDDLTHAIIGGAGGSTLTIGQTQFDMGFSTAYTDALAVGALSMAGVAASLPIARRVAATTAALTVAGVAGSLPVTRRLAAATGALNVSGISAAIRIARRLQALAGSLIVAGINALFPVTPGPGSGPSLDLLVSDTRLAVDDGSTSLAVDNGRTRLVADRGVTSLVCDDGRTRLIPD